MFLCCHCQARSKSKPSLTKFRVGHNILLSLLERVHVLSTNFEGSFAARGQKIKGPPPPFLGCFDTFPNNACPILICPFSFPSSLLLLPSHISDIQTTRQLAISQWGHFYNLSTFLSSLTISAKHFLTLSLIGGGGGTDLPPNR